MTRYLAIAGARRALANTGAKLAAVYKKTWEDPWVYAVGGEEITRSRLEAKIGHEIFAYQPVDRSMI